MALRLPDSQKNGFVKDRSEKGKKRSVLSCFRFDLIGGFLWEKTSVIFHCIFVSRMSRRGGRGTGNSRFTERKGIIGFVVISFHTVQAEIRQPGGEILHLGWHEGTDVKR